VKSGLFLIDADKKTAHLLNGGVAKFNTTKLSTVALAIVRLLSLPITTQSGASLSDYGDRFVYISSFLTSQREILSAVQRVTETSDGDWTITYVDGQEYFDEGNAKLAAGDFTGLANLIFGAAMKGDMGGDYESVNGVSNAELGLPKEHLDEAVRAALK
jgi:hypothetical protein